MNSKLLSLLLCTISSQLIKRFSFALLWSNSVFVNCIFYNILKKYSHIFFSSIKSKSQPKRIPNSSKKRNNILAYVVSTMAAFVVIILCY